MGASMEGLTEGMFQLSAGVLCVFPLLVFLQMLSPGLSRLASRPRSSLPASAARADADEGRTAGSAGALVALAAALALVPLLLLLPKSSAFNLPSPGAPPHAPPSLPAGAHADATSGSTAPNAASTVGSLAGVTLTCLLFRSVYHAVATGPVPPRERLASGGTTPRAKQAKMSPCASARALALDQELLESPSQWHKVSLFLRDWLDDETGLLHFVTEMPRGSLKKFELQTTLEGNLIREDAKATEKLKAFGKPVPFNYGCFPQTYRDPLQHDELHCAPGDDDPLDVIDVSFRTLRVGEVALCRVLGAVCLIDEGQADWKIFVTSQLEDDGGAPLHSMTEVERRWPNRAMQILTWMDDFKQHQDTGATHLHYHVHSSEVALSIVRKDHEAYKRLVAEADEHGYARGHWIHSPVPQDPWARPRPVPARGPPALAGAGVVAWATTSRSHSRTSSSSGSSADHERSP
ncbi:unnamed protein product [Durusdinium trenchii]|uniref:inorganic diphosphatase n=1 Tax=Durusdinium trenchii TaxID=1381693 RepID=A0ABP0NPR7_9DINO